MRRSSGADLRAPGARTPCVNRREFLASAAAAPVALAAAPRLHARGLGGMLVALVTADTESRIVAVDLASGRVLGRLATLPGPRSIESVLGRQAVVAHTSEGAVTIVEGAVPSIRRVLRAFGEPRYTAATPDGRYAYVTDSARGEVVVLDLRRSRVVHRTDVGGPARHLSLDTTGRRLWVSLGSKAASVALLDLRDPARPRLLGRIAPPFLAHDVGFAPDGRAWVTSGDRNELAVYDPGQRRVLHRLAAGSPPQHVTFARGLAFVTSGKDGSLSVHELRTGRVLETTSVPVGSYNVQEGFGAVLTPSLDRGTLCVLSGRGKLIRRVQVAPSSHDACVMRRD